MSNGIARAIVFATTISTSTATTTGATTTMLNRNRATRLWLRSGIARAIVFLLPATAFLLRVALRPVAFLLPAATTTTTAATIALLNRHRHW